MLLLRCPRLNIHQNGDNVLVGIAPISIIYLIFNRVSFILGMHPQRFDVTQTIEKCSRNSNLVSRNPWTTLLYLCCGRRLGLNLRICGSYTPGFKHLRITTISPTTFRQTNEIVAFYQCCISAFADSVGPLGKLHE